MVHQRPQEDDGHSYRIDVYDVQGEQALSTSGVSMPSTAFLQSDSFVDENHKGVQNRFTLRDLTFGQYGRVLGGLKTGARCTEEELRRLLAASA